MLKPNRQGKGLEMRTFEGKDGRSYLVFRTPRGSYHTFVEVEAKEAARDCGYPEPKGHTNEMWDTLWEQAQVGQ